jgi:hypothetical protein
VKGVNLHEKDDYPYFDQKSSGRIVFEGFYRMRRDKWATKKKRPSPLSSKVSSRSAPASNAANTYWLQFVEKVTTIHVTASLRRQLNDAAKQYLASQPTNYLGNPTKQFPLAELKRYKAS